MAFQNKQLDNTEAYISAEKWLLKRNFSGESTLDFKWEQLTSQRTMHKYFPYTTFLWRTKIYSVELLYMLILKKKPKNSKRSFFLRHLF